MIDITYDLTTSTDFITYGKDLFAAVIDNLQFELRVSPNENRLLLGMGVPHSSTTNQQSLIDRLHVVSTISEGNAVFYDHFVRIPIQVDEHWLDRLQKYMNISILWAKENGIQSGCFLCGNTDGTSFFREDGKNNTYICDLCTDSQQETAKLDKAERAYRSSISLQNEKIVLGLLISFLARIMISFILVFAASRIYTINLLCEDPIEQFSSSTKISILIFFLITFIMMRVYKKAAGSLSGIGILITGVLSGIMFFLDYIIILPLALQQAFSILGLEIPSSRLEILLNLDRYLAVLSADKLYYMIIFPAVSAILAAMIFDYVRYKIGN